MIIIRFTVIYGDESKQVVLTRPDYGRTTWEIKIDGKVCGEIFERVGGYSYHDNYFDMDDIQGMVDRITEYKNEPYQIAQFSKFGTWAEHREKLLQEYYKRKNITLK